MVSIGFDLAGGPTRARRTPALAAARVPASALVLVLALAACGGGEPVRPDRFYRLDPTPLEGPAGPPAPVVLQVNDLGARGFLGGRAIVFRTLEEPRVTQRYGHFLWEEPPTRAIPQALVDAIRAARVVALVVVPADRARADFLLGGEVERFEHRPTDRPPRVVAALNLALVRAADRGSLATRQYSGEEPVAGDTPDAMAEAFDRLAARLLAQAVRDLQGLKSRLAPHRAP